MERHKHKLASNQGTTIDIRHTSSDLCWHAYRIPQVRIRDLWLVGSQTQVMTAGALLYAKNAQKCQFTNLQLTNFYVGIRAESVSLNTAAGKIILMIVDVK